MIAKKEHPIFDQMKNQVLNIDPVHFCENNLTLDGKPFRINGNGYKPFAEIYRYIGVKALEKDAKPVVIVKGRQVGATTMGAALELFFCCSALFGVHSRPPMRLLHAFPLLDIAYRYTKSKLNVMITNAMPDPNVPKKAGKSKSIIENKMDKSSTANNSIQFKQFENGNCVFIESTGLDGNRIQGITLDSIFYDEVQDIPGAALAKSVESLKKSQYGPVGMGIQVYFGTPKQKGTDFHKLWQASSRQYYHLGCENCNKDFPLYTPESDEWMNIWIEDKLPVKHPSHGFIVRCPHCNHEQDKRGAAERGKWVPLNNDPNCEYVGFHINQLYMPDFNRDFIIKQKPENHPYRTERAYQNEVLGEFFSGQSFLITTEEIREYCGDFDRSMAERITLEQNKLVFAGFDWGEKIDSDIFTKGEKTKNQGQSYSSIVVISVDGPELLSIEYAKLLKSNDPDYKKAFIDQAMRQFNITQAVGDIGHSEDLSKTLQKEYGERFLVSRACGSVKNHIKYDDEVWPVEIKFERNIWMDELFTNMKKGLIRFPMRSYEKIGWLCIHCSSMEIKVSKDRFGASNIMYVKGDTPNDGFMALLNAYLAYLSWKTNKFNNMEPNRMRQETTRKQDIPCVAGYIPGMSAANRISKSFGR